MNIRDAREEIIRTIRAYTARREDGSCSIPLLRQRPLLLIGPPGIGKTAVMEQAARACGVGFVSYTMTHHTRQSAVGLPYIEERQFDGEKYQVTEYTMSEIIASVYRCMEETGCRDGLLFLDEINCVSETLAPAMLQFLQNKTFGSHRLPDGWVLAAAGNPPEYNKSVREFDIATLDRLKYISVEADYDAWRTYALSENLHGAIIAYLDIHPENFYILKQTWASRSFTTARGWEDLSWALKEYEELGFPVGPDLIRQYLQEENTARDFAGFYQLYLSRGRTLPVSEFLSGDRKSTRICGGLLQKGDREEQMYLVHLMLSCISKKLTDWRDACRQCRQFSDAADRLLRFCREQNSELPSEAMEAFLKKEQEVLRVRKTHALSSEKELQELQQTLYQMQRLGYHLKEQHRGTSGTAEQTRTEQELLQQDIRQKQLHCGEIAQEILLMLEQAVSVLWHPASEAGKSAGSANPSSAAQDCADSQTNAVSVFFLATLYQNPLAQEFFKSYPDHACASLWGQLDFEAKETSLKKLLQS